jgi:hypothetical protein
LYPDQSTIDRPTVESLRPLRAGLIAVLSGADGPVRRVLAIGCAVTATVSASAIVEIVVTNYLI